MDVKKGQVWQDNDPRYKRWKHGYKRLIVVLRVLSDGRALVRNLKTSRKTKIRLSRFKPTNTGYKFVSEV